jgi:hypothetical protein
MMSLHPADEPQGIARILDMDVESALAGVDIQQGCSHPLVRAGRKC